MFCADPAGASPPPPSSQRLDPATADGCEDPPPLPLPAPMVSAASKRAAQQAIESGRGAPLLVEVCVEQTPFPHTSADFYVTVKVCGTGLLCK